MANNGLWDDDDMDMLGDAIAQNGPLVLALGGLAIGCLFGAVVFATDFLRHGLALHIHKFRTGAASAPTSRRRHGAGRRPAAAGGRHRRARKSMYLASANINWVGHILGGLIFGFGMVFTGGCPSRNLARAGAGDLRSLLVLVVMGLFAYMAIRGVSAPVRAALEQATSFGSSSQSLGSILAKTAGLASVTGSIIVAALLAAAALAYCFGNKGFRASAVHVFSGVAIGLIVIAGWALTGLAFDDMATKPVPPISLTYVRPTGDALQWLVLFTAEPMPGFGTASVFGALIGAFVAALAMGRFRITTFSDTGDTLRNLAGAALMGLGGVMALGCTIGQGITGVSTLALGSFLTFAAIVAGGFWGLRVLERQIMAA